MNLALWDSFGIDEAANPAVSRLRTAAAHFAVAIEEGVHPHPQRNDAVALLRRSLVAAETAYLCAGGPEVAALQPLLVPAEPVDEPEPSPPPPKKAARSKKKATAKGA